MDEAEVRSYFQEMLKELKIIAAATVATFLIITGVTMFATYKYIDTSIRMNNAVDLFNQSLDSIDWPKP